MRLSKFQWESAIKTSVAPALRHPSIAAFPSWVIRRRLCWYASPPLVGSVSISRTTPQIPSMSMEMKAFISCAADGIVRIALTFRRLRSLRRRGIPGARLSVETRTCITSTGACPRGGVRPHHGIEEEQDDEESEERQALIDSRSPISVLN